MTSSQVYQSLPGAVDPTQLCGDISAGLVSTDWYSPGLYSYQDSFVPPYGPALMDNHPWPSRPSGIGNSYALLQNISLDPAHSAPPPHASGPHSQHPSPRRQSRTLSQTSPTALRRPTSGQASFDGAAPWTSSGGLGIQYTTAPAMSTPATSTIGQGYFPTYNIEEEGGSVSSPPELQQPKSTRPYPNIAPHPVGAGVKRAREDDDFSMPTGTSESIQTSSGRKRKRTSSVISNDLNEDDRFLVQLKEDENLPWKEIATRFLSDKGKTLQVAALQMRYKRLREKFRTWEDQDMNALRLAHEYWEKYKWEIISAKMLDFGIEERWPVRNCARKWQELEAGITSTASPPQQPQQLHQQRSASASGLSNMYSVAGGYQPNVSAASSMLTPAMTTSQFSSPIQAPAPLQMSYLPMQ